MFIVVIIIIVTLGPAYSNQSIKTLIQVDEPQRDKVKRIHMLKWILKIRCTMINNNNSMVVFLFSAVSLFSFWFRAVD